MYFTGISCIFVHGLMVNFIFRCSSVHASKLIFDGCSFVPVTWPCQFKFVPTVLFFALLFVCLMWIAISFVLCRPDQRTLTTTSLKTNTFAGTAVFLTKIDQSVFANKCVDREKSSHWRANNKRSFEPLIRLCAGRIRAIYNIMGVLLSFV